MHCYKQGLEARQIRGLALVSVDSAIRRINKLHYKVKSQSSEETWYDVVRTYETGRQDSRQEGQWTCSCPDFLYRKIVCKHIYAVGFSKELRRRIVPQDVAPISLNPVPTLGFNTCDKCHSESSIIKYGIRHNKSGDIQRYRCKSCNHKFIVNHGFERNRANPKAVTAALDLYFKGVSLRKVCDHLKQFYGIAVSHVAVLKWICKFVDIVQPYVDSITPPHLSGISHVDEMVVHVRREQMEKGHYSWLWNLMDETTRFWISSMVSERREVADARAVFQDARIKTGSPSAIIHDGLPSYDKAYRQEYFRSRKHVKNIRSISVRNEGLNSMVERLNGTMRDREKVMRGMHSKESAQKLINAMRIHYNYCRDHSKLGKTPAEQAGISLPLNQNKIESLMKLAATKG